MDWSLDRRDDDVDECVDEMEVVETVFVEWLLLPPFAGTIPTLDADDLDPFDEEESFE